MIIITFVIRGYLEERAIVPRYLEEHNCPIFCSFSPRIIPQDETPAVILSLMQRMGFIERSVT